jgi:hypothetical protein
MHGAKKKSAANHTSVTRTPSQATAATPRRSGGPSPAWQDRVQVVAELVLAAAVVVEKGIIAWLLRAT